MTTNQILLGFALTAALAVGSQVLATRLRVPALIVLLPIGFAAGALVPEMNPNQLLGPAFQPLVALAVALILYDAGLGLDLRKLTGHNRKVVFRLIALGVPITWGIGFLGAASLLTSSTPAALLLAAILVVSGPTVVGPLLGYVRAKYRLQRILLWEGSLIDPVGAILGAVVLNAIIASSTVSLWHPIVEFATSMIIGVLGGVVGTALLWVLLRTLRLEGVLGSTAQFATVIVVAAGTDIVRDDTGLIAAILMGLAVANIRGFDVSARRPFFETLVQLIIGLLFISISATVTPASVWPILLPTLGLVALLVLIARPLVAAVSTARTDLTGRERAFIGWMAPRGIVAAATAATFSASLAEEGIPGADAVLPVTFVVIVATVGIYGLTARPVARLLGVTRPTGTRPLLVGDEPWVVDLADALRAAGLHVLVWAGPEAVRQRIRDAGLDLAPGELLAAATGRGEELEGVTAVLLLTGEDDFNALASTMLAGDSVDGPVYRLAPPPDRHGVVASYTGGLVLFGGELTRDVIARRHATGAQVVTISDGQAIPAGHDLLFRVRAGGHLVPVTDDGAPTPEPGDAVVLLGPAGAARPEGTSADEVGLR